MERNHGFVYGSKYKLADVQRLLAWNKQENGQNVGGYKCHRDTDTMPIFVKYESSQYADRFLNDQEMHWFSKNGRTPGSPEFAWMNSRRDDWNQTHFIPLFVMRKEEAKEAMYYYVGRVASFSEPQLQIRESEDGKTDRVTVTDLRLAEPLDAVLYKHLTGMDEL